MILFEEKDLEEIIRDTLDKFDESNLKSSAAREAIMRKIMEGIENKSTRIEDQKFLSGQRN